MTVKEWLLQDRQWLREHRLQHARYKLSQSVTENDKNFWRQVIEANRELN